MSERRDRDVSHGRGGVPNWSTTPGARRRDAALLASAMIFGTLPNAILLGLLTAKALPAPEDVRFAVGYAVIIPIWIAGTCVVALAKTGARAWFACLSILALLSFVTR